MVCHVPPFRFGQAAVIAGPFANYMKGLRDPQGLEPLTPSCAYFQFGSLIDLAAEPDVAWLV